MRCSLNVGVSLIVLVVVAFGSVLSLRGADDERDTPSADELKARLRFAGQHVRRFELRRVAEGGLRGDSEGGLRSGDEVIELSDRPLLAYGDAARVNNNGTLWAWGKSGRPVAFMELFQGSEKRTQNGSMRSH